jgi:hypothetical protein
MKPRLLAMIAVAGTFLAAPSVEAQSVLQVNANVGGAVFSVAAGGTVPLTATGIGQPILASFTVRYSGTATASITAVSITGTADMTVLPGPTFPVNLGPNGATSFTVQYLPSTGNLVTGRLAVTFTENSQASTFPLVLTGAAPNLTFSYFIPPNGNLTDLNPGDRITFPANNAGNTVTATVNVFNRGSLAGLVQAVALAGTGYQLIGAPGSMLLQPGQQLSFNVAFTPQTTGSSQATLTIALNNTNVTFPVIGTATTSTFLGTYTLADGVVHPLAEGSAISFPAVDINGNTTATIDIVNQGTGNGTITGISVSGAAFRVTGSPLLPATVAAGQGVRFGIVFAPTRSGAYTGTFRLDLSGRSIAGTLNGSTASASLSLAYVDPDTNNVVPLRDGSTLPFPDTQAGAVSSVTLLVTNSGVGTGVVNSIGLENNSSAAFQLLNLPSLPASVAPSQQLRFGVRFNPQEQKFASAALALNLDGQPVRVNMQAQATGPQFTFAWSTGTEAIPVVSGGTITVSDTAVGQTSTATIVVRNDGTGDGQIAAIAVTGQGYSLTELPSLPLTLRSNASQRFTLNFAPAQPGVSNGRLTIGSNTFLLSGTGIGTRLTYAYTNAAASTAVLDGGVVLFAPTAVGSHDSVDFSIENTGTSAATISSINLGANSTVFLLRELPPLPLNLNPGARITFPVVFSPDNTGTLTAALRVNTATFTLTASGTQPMSLPAYQLDGPSGNQQAAKQPSIGLTLSAPYPLALQGSLKLAFVSDVFTDDPAVQFANGGRTVSFTIAANSTKALFNGGTATAVPLQTGTTAGNIVITPTFTTQAGFDLTPTSAAALTITIPRSVPQLVNATVTVQSTTAFTIALSGYSTSRSLRQLDVQVTPKQGESLPGSHLTVDVSSAAGAWFQSSGSQVFGGSFLMAIPFVLQNGSTAEDLVHRLQSVSITASNEVGTSNALTVTIP